ncbi:MAG TPA: hypothetical protein DD670_17740 [Planctomycetaceae bacterium]|nr:hypothetical protein [Planctomycetaceae bacterium]
MLGAWEFAISGGGYVPGEPAYLSFDVGGGLDRDGMQVWHYDGVAWNEYDARDLTYNGQYASFTVDGFSGYAVTGNPVPEPSLLGLLLPLGVALLRRRRRRDP